jgi:hypothetical protein
MTTQAKHFQPPRLAAHTTERIPTFKDLDLAGADAVARRYSDIRSKLDRSVTSPDPTTPLGADPWREVAQLFGSIGESLTLAIGCEIEIEIHRQARNDGRAPEQMIVGERFFAESEAQRVFELGHRAINLGFRAFALRAEWRNKTTTKNLAIVAAPFSTSPENWASLTEGKAEGFRELCANVDHPSAVKMACALKSLEASTEWRAVVEQRGRDFHRGRLESAVLAGVDVGSSGFENMLNTDGKVIGTRKKMGTSKYIAADHLEEQVTQIAHDALRRLVEALESFADGFLACIEPLSSGSYTWSFENSTISSHLRDWDDASCSCCAAD